MNEYKEIAYFEASMEKLLALLVQSKSESDRLANFSKQSGLLIDAAKCEGMTETYSAIIAAIKTVLERGRATENPTMDKNFIRECAKAIAAKLPDNWGFFVICAEYGAISGANRMFYTSTIERDDALNLMKEFLIRAGSTDEWLKHIK